MGQIKIIGGIHRSRTIKFGNGVETLRPTPSIMRERLFNWLTQDLDGKKCLDLFAGSGALGFEAVSRNAKSVVMVEINKNAIKNLKTNKDLLKAENITLISYPAVKFLETTDEKFDIIFVDPPYDSDLLQQSLKVIRVRHAAILADNAVIYIEYHTKPELEGFVVLKESKPGFVNAALIKYENK